MKDLNNLDTERQSWADFCRVISIYGVVVIHSCGASFYQYGKIPLCEWLQSVFLDSLVRCSVPLFVMLSGALILGRNQDGCGIDRDIKQIFRRTIRILVPLLMWSIVYLVHLSRNGVMVHFWSIFSIPAMYHLWFAYMMIGIYLILPILRCLFAGMRTSSAFLIYFVLLWMLVTSLPVYLPIPLLSIMQQSSLLGYGGYFLLGAVIASFPRFPLSNLIWLAVFVSGVVLTFLVTWHLSVKAGGAVETGFLYFSPNVVISSVAAFVLFSRIRQQGRWAKWFEYLSNCSFVVYFVHVLVLEFVRCSDKVVTFSQHVPTALTILLVSLVTFLLSLMIASLLRFIPGATRVFG